MKYLLSDKTINYDGSQLKPLYAYVNHKVHGDSIVSFVGKCDVQIDHMVDAEDFVVNAQIKSEQMLHFIVEVFKPDLLLGVALQRLLVSIAQQILGDLGHSFEREGDDLYFEKKKLSVSIASVSAVSLIIHLGVNVTNEGTPVPTCALADFKINPKTFAEKLLMKFSDEFDSMVLATQKVKPL